MAYTEAQQEKIIDLRNRAEELFDGIGIDINLVIKEGARLEWDSGIKFTEIDSCDGDDRSFWRAISEQYEKQMKLLREEFQAKIDAVMKESDELAKEVGEDPEEFFNNNIAT